MKGITKTGFEFEIDKGKLGKVSVVKLIARADDGDWKAIFPLMDRLLGEDQVEKLYCHLDEDGDPDIELVGETLEEIFEIVSEDEETKN